jgi:hypothetical protein
MVKQGYMEMQILYVSEEVPLRNTEDTIGSDTDADCTDPGIQH